MMPSTQNVVRLSCFLGVFLLMALWELAAPRRKLTAHKPLRWASNLGLTILNSLVVRVAVPISMVGTAILCASHGWGLLNQIALAPWVEIGVAVVLLDLVIYLQHVMFHTVPALWRLHMVHHADLDFDVTTGLRFHSLEIVLSTILKLATVLALGPPAASVLLFEVLLNATSMFNHSNVRMPLWLDRLLRLVIVTPDMHRVHHSVAVREANSNFGFNLPWWDYLLGTYRRQPAAGHEKMSIGLVDLRDEQKVDRLPWMLALPFIGTTGDYPINRRVGGDRRIDDFDDSK
jgi:sterol desaturase/sphingolipid hydroxylase (fatty acid hydroxylase superfamily)